MRHYYNVMCGLSGCNIFFFIFQKGMIFGKKISNVKCVLISTTFVCNIPHLKKKSAEYHKLHTSSNDVQVICARLQENRNFSTDFRKKKNIPFFFYPMCFRLCCFYLMYFLLCSCAVLCPVTVSQLY